jgi:hypothetical protein
VASHGPRPPRSLAGGASGGRGYWGSCRTADWSAQSKTSTKRPRTPPASNRRWASAACSVDTVGELAAEPLGEVGAAQDHDVRAQAPDQVLVGLGGIRDHGQAGDLGQLHHVAPAPSEQEGDHVKK